MIYNNSPSTQPDYCVTSVKFSDSQARGASASQQLHHVNPGAWRALAARHFIAGVG